MLRDSKIISEQKQPNKTSGVQNQENGEGQDKNEDGDTT